MAQVYGLSQACRFRLAFCACSLACCKSSLLVLCGALTGASHEVGYVGSGTRGTGGACGPVWGYLWAEHPQELVLGPPNGALDVLSRIHIPSVVFRAKVWLLVSQPLTTS